MKLSIITINLNNAGGLERTIKSVLGQSFTDYEYIIIDGGSSDNSLDILKQYDKRITRWISEKDKGVFDAMNNGIALSNGDYLLMLNSGDYFNSDDTLKNVFDHPAVKQQYDIIYGDVIWEERGVKSIQSFPDTLSFKFFRQHSIGHQAAFVKRTIHSRYELWYDADMKIAGDWKLFTLAFCKYNISYFHLPFAIAVCDRDGISCDPKNLELIFKEKASLLNKEFAPFLSDYAEAEKESFELSSIKKTKFYRLYNMYAQLLNKLKQR